MKKKKKYLSIKSSILISMSTLILLMLCILWLTQTVFLSQLYKYTRKTETEHAANIIVDNISSDNLEALISKIAIEYEVCVKIVNYSYETEIIYDEHFLNDCIIHQLIDDNDIMLYWYSCAEKYGGNYIEIIPRDKFRDFVYNPDDFDGDVPEKDDSDANCVVSVSIAENENGDTVMVILNSSILPMDATIKTLRTQLLIISVVMITVASIIAYVLSKRLSSPIEKINKAAKNLAVADYSVTFPKDGPLEIHELAQTLNHTAQELSKADKMQKELIANISHDLRTPLTMISGYSEVMRDIPGENTPENMQVIIDETARLSSLVSDLLNVSKLQSGKQPLNIARINLTLLILSVIKRYDKLISHNGYIINFVYEGEVFIDADEIRILQVIYNLINNALNYTGSDKMITVKQEIKDTIVRISVIDTGEGINENDLPLIWDRYYKVDKVHKRAQIGTGLGLSIVKSILLLHDSRFGVSSEQGKGSNFWFEFKISK